MALICIAIKAPIFVSGVLSHIIWCHPDCHGGTSIKSVIDRWQGPIKEQPRLFVAFLPLAINVLSLLSECSTPTYFFFFNSQLKWALPHGNFLSFPHLQVFSLPSMLPVKPWSVIIVTMDLSHLPSWLWVSWEQRPDFTHLCLFSVQHRQWHLN